MYTTNHPYESPLLTILEFRQEGVLCVSGARDEDDDANSREGHWTVDHDEDDVTPDDEWEDDQAQDWGDSWGEY